MLAGQPYDPLEPDLVVARQRARALCHALNQTREAEEEERRRILRELFGAGGDSVWMQPPFFCDYGSNIELGERVFFNFNCVVLDVCSVRIGPFSLFGPAVQIYTATHSFNAEERRREELGRPVEIGSRAFDLLVVLLASRGAIVSKNDIMKFVWPSVNVDESNLRFQIACLRKVLAHDRDVIKTISGRGYLFTTDVLDEFMSSCDAAEPSPASSRTSGSANGAWFAA